MTIAEKLRRWLKGDEFANDGSRELAQSWLDLLDKEHDMAGLLNHPAFEKILAQMKQDFLIRMKQKVEEDPELKAIKRMFIRTVGLNGTEERLEQYIKEFLDEPIDVSTKE